MTKQMVKQWYEYGYGLLFGQGDAGIGGEHGTDFNTPLFTPITALLPGTISGIQTGVNYGLTVTWKLDTPHNGVPYMYNIHLAAIAPGIQKGRHINEGTVIGYSGGATPESLPSDLANTPYTLPAGLSNYLDTSESSGGAHVEVGFTYNSSYGEGDGFYAGYLQRHPELNPKEFLDKIREKGRGTMLDIQAGAEYFSDLGNNGWNCTKTGCVVGHGILDFYRHFGGDALNGLTYLGLPLSNEVPIPPHSGVVFQRFERGVVCWDPKHEIDSPPGAGQVYLMHVGKG
jgi:Peptidase family M23/LGFP repeat